MRIGEALRIAAGAVMLAAIAWLLCAMPGFISDRESIVPANVAGGPEQ